MPCVIAQLFEIERPIPSHHWPRGCQTSTHQRHVGGVCGELPVGDERDARFLQHVVQQRDVLGVLLAVLGQRRHPLELQLLQELLVDEPGEGAVTGLRATSRVTGHGRSTGTCCHHSRSPDGNK